MLFLTATCSNDLILASFEQLIGVSCNSIHWPDSKDMVNMKAIIVVLYTGQWYHSAEKIIKQDVVHFLVR